MNKNRFEFFQEIICFLSGFSAMISHQENSRPGADHVRHICNFFHFEYSDHDDEMLLIQTLHNSMFREKNRPCMCKGIQKELSEEMKTKILESMIYLSGGASFKNAGIISVIYEEATGIFKDPLTIHRMAKQTNDFAHFAKNPVMETIYSVYDVIDSHPDDIPKNSYVEGIGKKQA